MVDRGTTVNNLSQSNISLANGQEGLPVYDKSISSNSISGVLLNSDRSVTITVPDFSTNALQYIAVRYYRLRGYYVAGDVFETWVTTNPSNSPPSGHTLTNITIVDTWK